jgi:hypothetical protein
VAYCTIGSNCQNTFPADFVTGAVVSEASDWSYIQVSGIIFSCLQPFLPYS